MYLTQTVFLKFKDTNVSSEVEASKYKQSPTLANACKAFANTKTKQIKDIL